MKLLLSLCLLLSTSFSFADELGDLEAKYSKLLSTVQRPVAENYVAELTRLEAAYRQGGNEKAASAVGREIKFINSQIAAGGPISLSPVSSISSMSSRSGTKRDGLKEPGMDDDLATTMPLELAEAARTGTIDYEEATGKLSGWKTGGVSWGRDVKLAEGTYEVIFEFSSPGSLGAGGALEIDVPGPDIEVTMGVGELSTATWAVSKSATVGTFEITERMAGTAFDFGIQIVAPTVAGNEVMHLSSILLRQKEGVE